MRSNRRLYFLSLVPPLGCNFLEERFCGTRPAVLKFPSASSRVSAVLDTVQIKGDQQHQFPQ